jgi:cytochrome c biogenesis protein CcmG/thiol:disulfide interchange protein DsbE
MRLLLRLALFLFIIPASLSLGQDIKTRMVSDFTLPDLDGNRVKLSDNFGQGPIYITFWATWCKPCLEEMKILQGFYKEYGERGFRVFAINTEGARAKGKVKSFVKSYGFTFDILIDRDGEVFRRKFKGFAMPFSVMTDPQGQIIFSAVGFKPGDEEHIEELIVNHLPGAGDDLGPAGSEQ